VRNHRPPQTSRARSRALRRAKAATATNSAVTILRLPTIVMAAAAAEAFMSECPDEILRNILANLSLAERCVAS
jgi:hypothetical protein